MPEKIVMTGSASDPEGWQDHVRTKMRRNVTELSRAFALSVPHEKALKISDEVGFFQLYLWGE